MIKKQSNLMHGIIYTGLEQKANLLLLSDASEHLFLSEASEL